MYVANTGSNTVSVIQGTTNIANVSVGPSPVEPTFDPANGDVYVPNAGGDTVSVLSGAEVDATVTVGSSPGTPAFDPANGDVYVPITGGCSDSYYGAACGDTVVAISGTSVVANLTVGSVPEQPGVDTNPGSPYFGDVYVPDGMTDSDGDGIMTVISDSNSIIAQINLGFGVAAGAFYDSQTDLVYAGISVIKGTTVVAQISAECNSDCVLDPFNGLIYAPGAGYPPVISGNESTMINCEDCGGDPVFDPVNGWVYDGGYAVAGSAPFAAILPSSNFGPDSFSPPAQSIYSSCGGCYYLNPAGGESFGNVVDVWGNSCAPAAYPYYYNDTLQALCNGAMPPTVLNQTVPVYSSTTGLPEALGGHVFSVQLDSVNMVSGSWNATTSAGALTHLTPAKVSFTVTGPSGTTGWATITIPKVLVALYLFAQLQGQPGAPPASALQVAPTVYLDGEPLQTSYFTSDSENFYITFQVHFSTHTVTIEFVPYGSASTTASSTTQTTSPGQTTTTVSQSGTGPTTSTASSSTSGNSIAVLPSYWPFVALNAMVVFGLAAVGLRGRSPPRTLVTYHPDKFRKP